MALHTHMALLHLWAACPSTWILLADVMLSVRRSRATVSGYLAVVWHIAHVRSWCRRSAPVDVITSVLSFEGLLERLGAADKEKQRRTYGQECNASDDDSYNRSGGKVYTVRR